MKYKIGDKVVVKQGNIESICPVAGRVGIIISYNAVLHNYLVDFEDGFKIWCDIEGYAPNNQKIVITTDGKITTAKLYENGKVVKTAEAKCHSEDTFDFNVGAKLAVERLIAPVDEWKVVKRPVKVGDYIRLIKTNYSFDCIGDILKVDYVIGKSGAVHVFEKNHTNKDKITHYGGYRNPNFAWCYSSYEYEIVEKVTNEVKETPKYYNGKVVCVKARYPEYWTVGKVYEIVNGSVFDNGGANRKFGIRSIDDARHMGDSRNEFIPFVEN